MKLKLDRAESKALFDLRGLPPDVHLMVMSMNITEDGGVVEGKAKTFEELVDFISEEIGEGMVSARAARALVSVCVKIDPHCKDWLGM